jgi:hypothetical protein
VRPCVSVMLFACLWCCGLFSCSFAFVCPSLLVSVSLCFSGSLFLWGGDVLAAVSMKGVGEPAEGALKVISIHSQSFPLHAAIHFLVQLHSLRYSLWSSSSPLVSSRYST